ncbi:MAG: hypothetical protein LBB56_02450 [Chitinispirillales bacterium]|jgi:hypothetical protein|nr:hypothetical protein [Chitinispirillales bacterium]
MAKQQSMAKSNAKDVRANNHSPQRKPTVAKTGNRPLKPDEYAVDALSPNYIRDIKENITESIDLFTELSDNDLTLSQRRRKVGAGVRNYGFIDKTSDLATSNPEFAKLFNIQDLKNCIRNIEDCRDIVILLQTLARMVSNSMMVYSDEAYSLALLYYNSAREMSRRGDPNAIEVFRALQTFFRRTRRANAEPSAKAIEKDLHALIKGTKDGKIVVENEKPRVVGGKRLLVDRTRNNKAAFKEVEEGEIDE